MSKKSRMRGAYASTRIKHDGELYQRCVFCGEVKPISDFPRNGTDKMGKADWRKDCKQCYNIQRKADRGAYHSVFIASQRRRGEDDVQYTLQEWKEALIFFGGECAYCGGTPRKGQRLTKDHLKPVSRDGLTIQSNIVPACSSCNSSKGAEDFKEWYMSQSFFSQERLNRIFKWRSIITQIEGGKQ